MKVKLENISNHIQQEADQALREAIVEWKKSAQAESQPYHDIFDESNFKDVRLNKLTIFEFMITASNDNRTINWVGYFISRPKYQ